jgi:hypothetical protein
MADNFVTDYERECAADALRRYEQDVRVLWNDLPKATKKKWLSKVEAAFGAVMRERARAS